VTAPGVRCDGVWKKYRRGRRHDSLRELVPALARALVRRDPELGRQEFWALSDVSFAAGPGDALGVIGPNGAGKSTVLKLLSHLVAPTRGRVEVRGRVGALIELAAGFHPDLTGRENIYLQGAIMGMRRAEIARRFDEIVAFAEVGEFIDTQIKRYSSGMNARLGFAIAAHLDAEVLLIDEVLAVGDFAFQRRAFERLRAIVRRQIPVVIVSHQLDRITELCTRAILLARGAVVRAGSAAECVAAYVDGDHLRGAGSDGPGSPPVRVDELAGPAPGETELVAGQPLELRLRGTVEERGGGTRAAVGVWVRTLPSEEIVFLTHTGLCDVTLPAAGPFDLVIGLDLNLGQGLYRVQPVVWRLGDRRPWAVGASLVFHVAQHPPGFGPAHLNPRMRLVSP
jgi:ABC-type polysaccharide/polyol phosphate transport system ATPase subunit